MQSYYTSLEDNFENEDEVHLEPSDYGAQEAETLRPTPVIQKTWTKRHIATLWVSMVIDLPSYLIGASLVSTGMTWYQACIIVMLGNFLLWFPMALNGHVGTKYGIPFPVFIRSVYGYKGAKIAAFARAIVACGWFGIQTYIGGQALYQLLCALSSKFENAPSMGGWMGINLAEFICFLLFWGINVIVAYRGLDLIKKVQFISTPILVLMAISLFIWAWVQVGSFTKILRASEGLSSPNSGIVRLTLSSVTGVVGSWAALALNIMDFTRFTHSHKDQMIGQLMALPTVTTLVAFLGIFVTSATVAIYGKPIWNPIHLIGQIGNPYTIIIAMFLIVLATMTTNIPANMVSPAIYFASLSPNWISFPMGIVITGLIGNLLLPWKLLADPNTYIYKWLIASSGGLGAVTGVMICDYWLIRKTEISLEHIYKSEGNYAGWNIRAFFATGIAILPSIPGFIGTLLEIKGFPEWLLDIYDYAWFTSFVIAFPVYYIVNRLNRGAKYERLEEKSLYSVVATSYNT